tara:strand:+ start:87561 stop:88160 length:600 start_codon:yes stop_codon:yes gene_type:complete
MGRQLFKIIIYLFAVVTLGQTRMVTATILDQSKTPLPGVTVIVEGTKKGIQTNFDGNFSLEVEKKQNLIISYLGFKTKKIKFKNLGNSVITLKEEYTNCFPTSDYYLPYKIYDIPSDDLNTRQDLFNAIQSQVPGVTISNTTLNHIPKIIMRGDAKNIVIVDGVRFDASIINTLNAQDIERVEVATSVAASNYLLTNRN